MFLRFFSINSGMYAGKHWILLTPPLIQSSTYSLTFLLNFTPVWLKSCTQDIFTKYLNILFNLKFLETSTRWNDCIDATYFESKCEKDKTCKNQWSVENHFQHSSTVMLSKFIQPKVSRNFSVEVIYGCSFIPT